MPTYKYRALNDFGRAITGQIIARSERELVSLLNQMGLELIDFTDTDNVRSFNFFKNKVKTRDIVNFCIQVEQMSKAGVPLLESLAEIRSGISSPTLKDSVAQVQKDIVEGKSLGEAFQDQKAIFGTVFITLIQTGEQSGKLDLCLRRIIDYLRWRDDINEKTKKATTYPAFMLLMVVGVMSFLMSFVVPQVVGFLESSGEVLPWPTKALIATSDFFLNYWYILFIVPLLSALLIWIARRNSTSARLITDSILLELPVFGPIIKGLALAQFSRILAIMYQSNIPILNGLEISRNLLSNMRLQQMAELVINRVSAGDSLSMAFQNTGEWRSADIRMITVGETSGELDSMLDLISNDYNRNVNEAIERMIGMIEPTLTLIMGGMMAWIAIAVFGPVYDTISKLDF